MPLPHDKVLGGEFEVIRQPGPRKLYLIPGKILGMSVPQTLVALDEKELEEYKRIFSLVIEIGDAHPDLAPGIEWEVYGIRRVDITELPGHPMRRKKGDSGVSVENE